MVALGIQPIYTAVDSWLGGVSVANLLLRFISFALFLLLGKILARVYTDSLVAEWLIAGRPGLWACGLASGLTLGAFLLGAFDNSSGQLAQNAASVVYTLTWRFYLSYVSAVLLSVLIPVVFDITRSDSFRWSAILQSLGYLMVFLIPFATLAKIGQLWDSDHFVRVLTYGSVIFVAAGFMIGWIVARRERQAQIK
ncbi:hypothetical protein ODZ83_05415 [Acaricomes phytoseiuli]|nr:hypothetical protein [Acaricomes phytoseiuli]